MRIYLILAILIFGFTIARAQDEQAPIVEKEFKYNDWTYSSVRDGTPINLRGFTKGKKLVLVVYFAAWCSNWRHEAPFVEKLYEKYKANGFDVIGVAEYDTLEATQKDLETKKISFPVVIDSNSRDARLTTLHYGYRNETGDTRKWGSPWNVFLFPDDLKKKGEVLSKKSFVVNGELIEAEAERFVREKLGLPAEEKKTLQNDAKTIEVCDSDEKKPALKKP
jgi:peroxiredoxin